MLPTTATAVLVAAVALSTMTSCQDDPAPDPVADATAESSSETSSIAPSSAPTTTPSTTPSTEIGTLPTTTATPDKPPIGNAESVFPDGDIDHGLDPYIRRATDDLATRLGIDSETITVVSAVLVRWPDSSLGCPDPDMAYATVVTDGSVIELAVGEGADRVVYRYHSGGAERPFLCERALRSTPPRG